MEAIVGLADNDQTTPFAVIVPQVVLMVFPPLLALVEVMAVAVTVVTAGVPLIPLPVTAVVMLAAPPPLMVILPSKLAADDGVNFT